MLLAWFMRTSTTILTPPHPQQQQQHHHQDHKENEDKQHPMIWLNQIQNSLSRDTTTTNIKNNSNHKSGSNGATTTTGGDHVSLSSSSTTNCDTATSNRCVSDQRMLQPSQNIITIDLIITKLGGFHGMLFSSTIGTYMDGDTATLNSYKTETPNNQMSRFSSMR